MRRERFFAEVRITRQLSHPNICRVYDIGEIDGWHFLSMKFIDGEDLASLIKRIGYLSNEKALDIAELQQYMDFGLVFCLDPDNRAKIINIHQIVVPAS